MRIRQAIWIILAGAIGYAIGNGPVSEWIVDLGHMLSVEYARARDSGGNNGILALLISGFLIGQALYLFARRLIDSIGPVLAQSTERLAAWDASLSLPRRFGLHQYLEQCTRWADEDPTVRMPSLALFKVHGIGELNEKQGTQIATKLLQRIATEVRVFSLPDTSSSGAHWLMRHLPRPLVVAAREMPLPRYPARWSGSTFALAFRELDMLQALSVTRSLAGWIRGELAVFDLQLSVGIAFGRAGVSARGLCDAATKSLSYDKNAVLSVVSDPTDLRGETISQMPDVAHRELTMRSRDKNAGQAAASEKARLGTWLRIWGPPIGCLIAAALVIGFTGKSREALAPSQYPWPDNLTELQIVNRTGPKTVRIVRSSLPTLSSGGWTLSNGTFAQASPAEKGSPQCQMRITITNATGRTYYVSASDFEVADSNGTRWALGPVRMLRLTDGIAGRWMNPGDTWTGWLLLARRGAPITEVSFQPDRSTRIVLPTSVEPTQQ